MTLRDTIETLRAYADVANDEHQVKVRTGQFAELSDRLGPALADLPGLQVGLAELQQLDLEPPPASDEEAAQVIASLRALAAELPFVKVDQNLDLAKARVRSALKYVSELRTVVAGVWHAHVSQQLPAINSDLVDALARSGVEVHEIRDALEDARGRLFALSNRRIPTQGDVKRYRSAIAVIHDCGGKLGEVVDEDIAEGIVKSQKDIGMPLTWFTPQRLEKLATLGILDRFHVWLR